MKIVTHKNKVHAIGTEIRRGEMKVQMTLEQLRFKLHSSTYMQIFSTASAIALYDLWSIEFMDIGEPQIWRANSELYTDFQLHRRSVPLNSVLIKGQLYTIVGFLGVFLGRALSIWRFPS